MAQDWLADVRRYDANADEAIAEIDTRKLTRILREKGAKSGCIITGEEDVERAIAHARKFPGLAGMDLARIVSTESTYQWSLGLGWPAVEGQRAPGNSIESLLGAR